MSVINNALQGKKVLVTGATGFIGGRLAERLAAEEGAVVTGTGRSLDKVPFVKEAGVDLRRVDLQDEAALCRVVTGQEVIFHTAAWLKRHGQAEEAYDLNVAAVETILRMADAAGVRRFVHVGSISSYGVPEQTVMDESQPVDTEQHDVYGRTKAKGELRALELGQELDLEVTVVRPGMVYGPRSQGWTIEMIKLLEKGLPVIFGHGSGHAFPIYIDNLVDGMLLAAVSPHAPGEAFNLCDPVITLRKWFEYYGRMSGHRPRRMPMWVANLLLLAKEHLGLNLPINRERLQMLSLQTVYPTDKAETMLGFQSRIPIEEGMKRTEAWLRAEGVIS